MNKKQLIVVWLMWVVLLSGCATFESICINAKTINYCDGINEKEAKYIAQKYFLEQGIQDAFISFPGVEECFFRRQQWRVTFQKKNLSQLYVLFIDKATGEVTYVGYEE
jgi:hypothetical protein